MNQTDLIRFGYKSPHPAGHSRRGLIITGLAGLVIIGGVVLYSGKSGPSPQDTSTGQTDAAATTVTGATTPNTDTATPGIDPPRRQRLLELPIPPTSGRQSPAPAISKVRQRPEPAATPLLTGTKPVSRPADTPQTATATEIPAVVPAAMTQPAPADNDSGWQQVSVKRGDSLSSIFDALHIHQRYLPALLKSKRLKKTLKKLYPGQTIRIRTDADGVAELQIQQDLLHSLHVRRQGKRYVAESITAKLEHQPAIATGTINNSLFGAAKAAGLPDKVIMELINVFGWDIDFALDIRKGDSFAVIYEELYKAGKKVGYGPILAAEFSNRGKSFQAVRYTDASGHTDYYDADGRSMRKTFRRTPVDYARISSRFTTRRWHPVLHKFRAHKGVDYAAGYGTPIKATGDGTVRFRGRKGGYGNTMIIDHGGKYTTLYAHMQKFANGKRKGSRVKQGQIIGYVGSSGLATGPHLHYEFRINGIHRNPLKVPLPKAKPIARQYLAHFKSSSKILIGQLNAITSGYAKAATGSDDANPVKVASRN